MAPSLVQQKYNTGTAAAASTTITSSTAGNLLVAIIAAGNNPGARTFSMGTGWVQVGTTQDQNTFIEISSSVWYYPNNPGGITSVTITASATSQAWSMAVLEYSGITTTSPLDVNAAKMATVNNATSGSQAVTTTAAGDLVLGIYIPDQTTAAGSPGTITEPSGWTALTGVLDNIGNWTGVEGAYIVQSSAGSITYNPSWTVGNDYTLFVVAFKAAGGGTTNGGTPTIAGTSSLSSAGIAAGTPTGHSTVSGSSDLLASASPTGTSSLSASPVLLDAASPTGTSTLVSAPDIISSVAATGTSSLTGSPVLLGIDTISGTSTLTGNTTGLLNGSGTLTGSSTLSASPVLDGIITILATSVLTGGANGAVNGSGSVGGSSGLSASACLLGTQTTTGTSTLSSAPQSRSSAFVTASSSLQVSSALLGVGSCLIGASSSLVGFPTVPNAPIVTALITIGTTRYTITFSISPRYTAEMSTP